MFKRLFPTLAKISPEKRWALLFIVAIAWIAIAGETERYFIAMDWIHVEQ
jgi:hypothetical protein